MSGNRQQPAPPAGTREDVDNTVDPSATDDAVPGSSPEEELDTDAGMLAALEEAAGISDEDTDGDDPDGDQGTSGDPEGADDEAGAADSDADKGKSGKDDAEKKPGEKDQKPDDGEDVEPGQRVPYDRFKTQIDLRKQATQERDDAVRERDQYVQGHQRFAAIDEFRERNGLAHEDIAQAIKIAGAINQDPAAALEQLRPIYERLSTAVGETLPEDIQARVDTGEISEADAKEMVRTRNENARLKHQQSESARQAQLASTQQEQVALRQKMVASASTEEKRLAARDPDFDKKRPFITQRLQVLIQERGPKTPEDAGTLVREAYEAVTSELAQFSRRPEVRKGPRSDNAGKGTGGAEPDSMLDAMLSAASES